MEREEKLKKIDSFLESLGEVKSMHRFDGFYLICKKCGSQNVRVYNDIGCGTELTGCWGEAGFKCTHCGNAAEFLQV